MLFNADHDAVEAFDVPNLQHQRLVAGDFDQVSASATVSVIGFSIKQ